MAGGKQDTRQKMINMMYLVFIAMLALNISKEVLATLGMINDNIDQATQDLFVDSGGKYKKFSDNETIPYYRVAASRTPKIELVAKEYFEYIATLKSTLINSSENGYMIERINEKTKEKDSVMDYQTMDKSQKLDSIFFIGNQYASGGKEFITRFTSFRENMLKQLDSLIIDDIARVEENPDDLNSKPAGFNFSSIENLLAERFEFFDSIPNREGKLLPYLDYHFKGFPLIASLSKLTKIQSDIRYVENKILESMLSTIGENEVGLDTYQTLLETTKSSYFTGQVVDASIVMGKKDSDFRPDREELQINGNPLTRGREYVVEDGVVKLNYVPRTAGNLNLTGKLFFKRDREELSVDVAQQISISTPPKDAIISADRMRKLYVGLPNDLSISIPNVAPNTIRVSTDANHGTIKRDGTKWLAVPNESRIGNEMAIRVSGIVNGDLQSMRPQSFKVKALPPAFGSIIVNGRKITSGEYPSGAIKRGVVTADYGDDFDYDVDVKVTQFQVKIGSSPSRTISSNKLSDVGSSIDAVGSGTEIKIFDIRAEISSLGRPLSVPRVTDFYLTVR
ncbi:MAG: hypothetical protein GWO82_01250 [Bacteroidetes bacterium]|nr:hypothetical protein [Bacteroidota bacterium]